MEHDQIPSLEADPARRAAHRRVEAYLDVAEVIMVALNRQGRVTLINRKGRQVLGYPNQELVGRDWFDTCIPAHSREEVRGVFARIMAGDIEPVEYFENPVVTKNGEERLVAWHNALLRDPTGQIEGTLSSGSDITERHLIDESLRASEARYRSLVEHMGEGVVQVDNDDRILFVNERLCRMVGKTKDELLGSIGYEILSVDERDRELIREKNRLRLAGVADSYETSMIGSNGETIRVSISGAPLFGPRGEVVGSVGLITDITERTRIEAALRRSEAFNQALIENSPIGISVRSRTGRLLSANAAWKRIWAITDSEMSRDATRERASLTFDQRDQYLGPYQADVRKVYEQGGYVRIPELRIRSSSPGAAEWISQHFYALADADGVVERVVILTEDITERKRAEKERERLQEELNHARKMESIGRLAGGVAHDFNNQLQVVLGHAEMALARGGSTESTRADLEEIVKAAGRSANLVRQLLAFARRQVVSPETVNLDESVAGALTMLRRLIGEEIELVWAPCEGLWSVRVDPTQIVQVLVNLCVNARDAIRGGGRVTVETGNRIIDAAYCATHPGASPGMYVMLSVTDDGCGMSREVLDHIFEPFFTTKDVGQGVGLGLATVYGIVKQNEGFVDVYSEPDHGTAIKVYLPRAETAAPPAPARRTVEEALPTGSETVLFIEDDTVILAMGKEMLEGLGYTVVTASSPEEGIRCAAASDRTIDLLITDVVMPEMNGRIVADRIAALRPETRCLFMSGYTADVIAHRGVLHEGVRFLQKPFTLRELATKVRETLDEAV